MAVEAFAPRMESFRRGRNFAAWLGLVPRQFSSGGKERLGRVSKAGQSDICRLIIIGAMSRLNWLGRKTIPEGSWLAGMAALYYAKRLALKDNAQSSTESRKARLGPPGDDHLRRS